MEQHGLSDGRLSVFLSVTIVSPSKTAEPIDMPFGERGTHCRVMDMDGSIVFVRCRQCAPPSNTCFIGPIWVHNPNGISIGSAVFACMTDRPTDRATSVTVGRIYARITAMRPKMNIVISHFSLLGEMSKFQLKSVTI